MKLQFHGATDVGVQRQNNEDTFFVEPLLQGTLLAACVIDGVGGYEGGEIAAATARETILKSLRESKAPDSTVLIQAMAAAHLQIIARRSKAAQLADMACVATTILADERKRQIAYCHVGDTRLYLFRDGSLVKISKDQSFVGLLEDSGRLSEQEAMQHPKRNEIEQALGFGHTAGLPPQYFDVGTSPFLPGDQLLLCSDGLSDLVPAQQISSILNGKDKLPQKTQSLIAAANNAGGRDNITVVLVRFPGVAQKRPVPIAKRTLPKQHPAPQENNQPTELIPAPEIKGNNPKRYRIWLPLLFVALAMAGYAWYKGQQPSPAAVYQQPTSELQLLINNAQDTLQLSASLEAKDLTLNDTLTINRDTLVIRGNGMHLFCDSSYKGPAFYLSPSCKQVIIQDLVLENFKTGIAGQGQHIRLQNVRFLNCSTPLQYGFAAPENTAVHAELKDTLIKAAAPLK